MNDVETQKSWQGLMKLMFFGTVTRTVIILTVLSHYINNKLWEWHDYWQMYFEDLMKMAK